MQNLYGPAIVMGLIIGAAIIADDFIQPSSRNEAMPLSAQHPTPTLYESDHRAWSMKQGGDETTEIHREMRIIVEDDPQQTGHDKTLIVVKVADEQIDPRTRDKGLAAAIREVVDAARSEGREPTEAEITAAVAAISGQANRIEVEVDATEARQQGE
ncbi:MAG: hypothetical protein ISP98_06195 [Luminiphilus sp.]|nr:hypothetical protein [Luminiphilus sp.]